jgi:hypothetical protein
MKLDDYFDAYDTTRDLAGAAPDWNNQRKAVRRALARPVLGLCWRVALLAAFSMLGVWGDPIGYFLALATLCFIPGYLQELCLIRGLSLLTCPPAPPSEICVG